MLDYVAYLIAQQRTDELSRFAHAKAPVQPANPDGQRTTVRPPWRLQLSQALHRLADRLAPPSAARQTGARSQPRRRHLSGDHAA